MIERKHRIEDALEAVRSAQEEGIVVGGGMALLKARRKLKPKGDNEDQIAGYKIVLKACEKPFRQIANNCGLDASVCLERAEKGKKDWGYNFQKNKLTNFVEDGIIDPVKVTRCALLNAVSVAGTLITSNHAIVEV
jgi:chaperonin GroEL